ncbi:MAG TPA: ABC transporter ATP-binding protein [Rhodothermales bacterium]
MNHHSLNLTATSVGMRYGRRRLFSDVSLRLERGARLAITGPNGSGKSTLLRILGGLLTPSTGTVTLRINDRRVSRQEHPLHVGIVAPYVNLYEPLTAAENLHFITRVRGLDGGNHRVDRMLESVGLADRAGDGVSTFSSGMIQRLRLAAALISEPPLLLLDEPTITLDEQGTRIVHDAVRQAADAGSIVILATNVPAESALCDSVCAIESYR